MAIIHGEIKRDGVSNTVKEEVSGNNMSELIKSIKVVKETLNELLSTIVAEEAGSSVTSNAEKEDAPEAEEGSSDDDPEQSAPETKKQRQQDS